MSSGVDVNIGADTREFERSVKSGLQEPVEDAQKALDNYARAGDEAGDQLSQTFRTQQQQTTTLKRDIDELNRSIQAGSQSTRRVQVADVDTFRKRSIEGFGEVKDSARQNAIETAASFTGGFDQALGGLQGLLSEIGIAFGPAGIIAGLVAASGIGLITSQLDGGTEAADAQKQAVAELATQFIELGKVGLSSTDDIKGRIEAMATSDGSDVVITLQKAWELSKAAGSDYQGVVEAIASASPAAIARAEAAVKRVGKAHEDNARAATNDGSQTYKAAIHGAVGADQLADALDKAEKQANQAARAQKLAAAAGLSDLSLKQGLIGQVEKAYDDAAGSATDFIKGEKGVFDVKGFLASFKKREQAIEDYHDALAKADLSPAQIKYLESQGVDTASAMLRGYQKASPAQQAALGKIWQTAGTENATNYKDAVGKSLKGATFAAPKIAKPVVPAPDSAMLDAFLARRRTLNIEVTGTSRDGKRVF